MVRVLYVVKFRHSQLVYHVFPQAHQSYCTSAVLVGTVYTSVPEMPVTYNLMARPRRDVVHVHTSVAHNHDCASPSTTLPFEVGVAGLFLFFFFFSSQLPVIGGQRLGTDQSREGQPK